MKVAVVFAQPPYLEGGAAGRCGAALLCGLAEHGVDVHAVAARQNALIPDGALPSGIDVEIIDVPRPPPIGGRLRRALLPRSELARGHCAERVRDVATAADIVHLVEIDSAWCARGVARPQVLQIEYLVRRDQAFGSPWRKRFRHITEFALAEALAVRHHRFVVANTPAVATGIARMRPRNRRVQVVPLALIPDMYSPATLDGPPLAGVIGTARWPPTETALHRLVTRVWPLVVDELPAAKLLIAGRGTDTIERLRQVQNAEVLGTVPSAGTFLRELGVLVVPIDRGSGMKVKVLEAMACGVPVVTTPAGAEGITPTDGIVVAESDAAIAAATVELLTSQEARQARGRAGRQTFMQEQTPGAATRPLVSLYEAIMGQCGS